MHRVFPPSKVELGKKAKTNSTVKTLAVSSRGGEEVLKAILHPGVCRKQLLIPCAQYGVQALPGHRLFSLIPFLLVLWLFSPSVACFSLVIRAAYTVMYDRYFFR